MSELEKFLKPEEVAEKLRIAVSTVYAWGKNGRLPMIKMGRSTRFSPQAISNYVKKASDAAYGKAA